MCHIIVTSLNCITESEQVRVGRVFGGVGGLGDTVLRRFR